MKIALCEWFPRVCGSTEWGFHLAAGAGKHQLDCLTFSKSGRPLKGWYRPEVWTTHRIRDAIDVLNTYDLVIAIDLVCFAPQLSGRKFFQQAEFAPYYVELLERIRTPWTAMYHGGLYGKKYDGILNRILRARHFSRTLITTRLPQARERLDHLTKYSISYLNDPYLPYDPRVVMDGVTTPKRRTHETIITSRIAVNKGQNVALGLLPRLAGNVHVWGYNAFGLPSIGWRLWELGNGLHYKVTKKVQLRRDCRNLTHSRASRFYTGEFAFQSGKNSYQYHDGFDHHREVDWAPWVHLSLTSTDFKGSLEYVSLNAIAAGCVALVPEHSLAYTRGGYRDAIPTVPFERCTWWAEEDMQYGKVKRTGGRKGKFVGYEKGVVDGINQLLTSSDLALANRNHNQREAVAQLHDPKRVLNRIISGVSR